MTEHLYTSQPAPADYLRLVLMRELNLNPQELEKLPFEEKLKYLIILSAEAKVARQKSRRR